MAVQVKPKRLKMTNGGNGSSFLRKENPLCLPHLERRVSVQLEHAEVDVVARQRASQRQKAHPDALVAVRVGGVTFMIS